MGLEVAKRALSRGSDAGGPSAGPPRRPCQRPRRRRAPRARRLDTCCRRSLSTGPRGRRAKGRGSRRRELDPARGQVGGERARALEVEEVAEAGSPGLDDDREVLVGADGVEEFLGPEPGDPQGRALAREPAGKEQRAARVLAELRAEDAGALERAAYEAVEGLPVGEPERRRVSGTRGGSKDSARGTDRRMRLSSTILRIGRPHSSSIAAARAMARPSFDREPPKRMQDELDGVPPRAGLFVDLDRNQGAYREGKAAQGRRPSAPRRSGSRRRPLAARSRSRSRARPLPPASSNLASASRRERARELSSGLRKRASPFQKGTMSGSAGALATTTASLPISTILQAWAPRVKTSPTLRSQTNSSSSSPIRVFEPAMRMENMPRSGDRPARGEEDAPGARARHDRTARLVDRHPGLELAQAGPRVLAREHGQGRVEERSRKRSKGGKDSMMSYNASSLRLSSGDDFQQDLSQHGLRGQDRGRVTSTARSATPFAAAAASTRSMPWKG